MGWENRGGGGGGGVPQNLIDDVSNTKKKVNSKAIYVFDYGANGDGLVDESLGIKSAIAYAKTVRVKRVVVPDGVYNIHSTVIVDRGIHLELSDDAVLKAKVDVNVVQIKPHGKLSGGVIDTSDIIFTKACIYLNGDDIFKLLNDHVYCNGTLLKGRDAEYTDQVWYGKGIHLYSGKGANNDPSYVSFTRFMQMGIFNFEYGILLETDQTITQESEMSWVNGNTFDQINMMNCPKSITLIGDSNIPRDVSGNEFSNMQVQINSYSDYAIYCEGGWNRFSGMWWDLHRQPSGAKAFQFNNTSRFNTIVSMHGYETPKHYDDNGYMNTIQSLTNHVPHIRQLFHPFATPYKPNSLGNQDDYMIGGHLRGYTVTQMQTVDPTRSPTITHAQGVDEVDYATGQFWTLFKTDTEKGVLWDAIQTDYDNPLVIEVDMTSDPIPLMGHIGIVSAYGAQPKNVVFEVDDGNGYMEYGDWTTDNTENPLVVSAPWANVDVGYKIRITMWGSNRPNGRIQVSRVFAMSTILAGNAWVPKDGGNVDGVLNLKGGMVLETRTDDPIYPDVGRIWLRTDL